MGRRVIILFLFSFSFFNAQNYIKGTIKNTENKPLFSANVIIKDDKGNIISYTYTDDTGNYNIETNKIGKHFVIASSLGYEQKRYEIVFESKNESKNVDFILVPKETKIEEIRQILEIMG